MANLKVKLFVLHVLRGRRRERYIEACAGGVGKSYSMPWRELWKGVVFHPYMVWLHSSV